MQIGKFNHVTQNRFFSGTEKKGNIALPTYTGFHFNTKTAPTMSDDKYKAAIIEQAKKDQAAGKFQTDSIGYKSLVKSYVSSVSPDRKNIIAKGLTAVFETNKPEPKTLTLLDYLFGSVKYTKEANNVSYAEFYDSNGEMVATYSNTGWTFYGTKAENARESELRGIYNQAWNSAAKASQESSDTACMTILA